MTMETAVFGGGCFWCTEAVFKSLKGVSAVTPGYAGGTTAHPTYDSIHGADTGHAEVVRVEFDPAVISYRDLLTVFFFSHDPTTKNRQGADVGPEYRSLILHTGEAQKREAEQFLTELKDGGTAAVTEVAPLTSFTEAEEEHRNFYRTHQGAPYCEIVIAPKIEKLQQRFRQLIGNNPDV